MSCTSSCDSPSGTSVASALCLCPQRLCFRERRILSLPGMRDCCSKQPGPSLPHSSPFCLGELVAPPCFSQGGIVSVQGKESPEKNNSDSSWLLLNINTGYFIPYTEKSTFSRNQQGPIYIYSLPDKPNSSFPVFQWLEKTSCFPWTTAPKSPYFGQVGLLMYL